jgi:hypothetical protein
MYAFKIKIMLNSQYVVFWLVEYHLIIHKYFFKK